MQGFVIFFKIEVMKKPYFGSREELRKKGFARSE